MAAVTITHPKVSSGTVNPNVEVDLHDWNQPHTVTGLENVDNTSDANKPISTATQAALDAKASPGHIYGITLSNGSDAVNDMDWGIGECASSAATPRLMKITSPITKRSDASWAVGTNQGGLDTGSIAAYDATSTTSLLIALGSKVFTTQASKQFVAGEVVHAVSAANPANWMNGVIASYSGTTLTVTVLRIGGSGTLADWNLSARVSLHNFVIARSDTGVVDACFSVSPSAPTTGGNIPAAYDHTRLVWSAVREIVPTTATATIRAFIQYGDLCKYAVAAFDYNAASAIADALLKLTVPSGIKVIPLIDGSIQMNAAGSGVMLMSDGDHSSSAYAIARAGNASEWSIIHSQNFVTNTAGQVWFLVLNSSGSLNLAQLKIHGYIHGRGR